MRETQPSRASRASISADGAENDSAERPLEGLYECTIDTNDSGSAGASAAPLNTAFAAATKPAAGAKRCLRVLEHTPSLSPIVCSSRHAARLERNASSITERDRFIQWTFETTVTDLLSRGTTVTDLPGPCSPNHQPLLSSKILASRVHGYQTLPRWHLGGWRCSVQCRAATAAAVHRRCRRRCLYWYIRYW